ncbi:hypothetical protein KIN20_022996 [Parelaphostrongylus tenuis]|uniref:Uncharacterized protein n=1 Tax=Parelaphostrongylus tenuis TaxID=148309 RepID=A0AAD5N6P0_PARTN|nr:hypothetical protein KIN20_022996 [Parelaphostrongylus tenuis]
MPHGVLNAKGVHRGEVKFGLRYRASFDTLSLEMTNRSTRDASKEICGAEKKGTMSHVLLQSDVINHVHYMGRHVGKARMIAGKIFKMAESLNVNRVNTGIRTASIN